jgi:hypothetical protein
MGSGRSSNCAKLQAMPWAIAEKTGDAYDVARHHFYCALKQMRGLLAAEARALRDIVRVPTQSISSSTISTNLGGRFL